jgi:hypothetical protein
MGGGSLKLISTWGWFGGDDNLAADLKSVSTWGWFWDIAHPGIRLKLPTTITASVDNTLNARCTP